MISNLCSIGVWVVRYEANSVKENIGKSLQVKEKSRWNKMTEEIIFIVRTLSIFFFMNMIVCYSLVKCNNIFKYEKIFGNRKDSFQCVRFRTYLCIGICEIVVFSIAVAAYCIQLFLFWFYIFFLLLTISFCGISVLCWNNRTCETYTTLIYA